MSDPAPKPTFDRRLHRLGEELPPEDIAQMDEAVPVDTEVYLRWLETGDRLDLCEAVRST